MIEMKRILCPIDFSDGSRRALDHAFALARWYGASITALHVSALPTVPYAAGPVVLEPVVGAHPNLEEVRALVLKFVGTESAPGVPVEALVREGRAADQILAVAGELAVDLCVLGTHGRSGFERLLLGSVAERVLRKAQCAVMTVPASLADAVPASPVVFKTILCPVDFSPSSMHALEYALSLAQEADGCLVVLHVVPDLEGIGIVDEREFDGPVGPPPRTTHDKMTVTDYLRQRVWDARIRLRGVVPADAAEFCKPETLLARGKVWQEILRVAADRSSDLIVMGVQGRGVTDLLLFGSTTHHVVRQATCPVLTLRSR